MTSPASSLGLGFAVLNNDWLVELVLLVSVFANRNAGRHVCHNTGRKHVVAVPFLVGFAHAHLLSIRTATADPF